MTQAYDVLVVGGGPAGLATGIALARLGRSVLVLEKTHYHRPRTGETFGGDLRPLLQELDAWEDFEAISPIPFRGVEFSWGGAELVERTSIFHPFGEGWHVDRPRFDEMLARIAARVGVTIAQDTVVRSCAWAKGAWHATTGAGLELTGRYVVDASGRGAPGTAALIPDRRWLRMDRQVALVGTMTPPANPLEPVLVLEAVEEGWWYPAPQPGETLLAVLITDADLLPARGPSALAGHLCARLGQSVHTAARCAGATLSAKPWIARSDSGVLLPDRGLAWRAVGDAAMACDPLAGDGVVRALRAALEAAPEINSGIDAPSSVGAVRDGVWTRFGSYLELRDRYYEREARWPNAPFWARRRPIAWQAAPLFLDPRQVLRRTGTLPTREQMAPVEALIPPGALRELVARLQNPQPAHEALTFLRSVAPVGDRKMLVGVQMLVALGCVSAGV